MTGWLVNALGSRQADRIDVLCQVIYRCKSKKVIGVSIAYFYFKYKMLIYAWWSDMNGPAAVDAQ